MSGELHVPGIDPVQLVGVTGFEPATPTSRMSNLRGPFWWQLRPANASFAWLRRYLENISESGPGHSLPFWRRKRSDKLHIETFSHVADRGQVDLTQLCAKLGLTPGSKPGSPPAQVTSPGREFRVGITR